MTRLEQFNEGQLEEALGEVTDDYVYTDPLVGRRADARRIWSSCAGILGAFPDREIAVTGAWTDGDTEFCEYVWTGDAGHRRRVGRSRMGRGAGVAGGQARAAPRFYRRLSPMSERSITAPLTLTRPR